MVRRKLAVLLLLVCPSIGAPLGAQCRLCEHEAAAPKRTSTRPLNIEVEAALDFSRAAGNSRGGSIAIDERTGARQVSGLSDLGGMALKGSVLVTGEPFGRVRISLPSNVRLTAPDGSTADAVDLRTDLSASPTLDANGELRFAFGGRLVVSGSASGDFRGRIPIVADYE